MKKIYILLCALAALAAASCTEKEDFAPAGEKVTREFTTVLTKTTLHTDGATVYWEDTDAISIFDGVSNNQFDIQGYDNGSPSASATFSGTVDAGATSFYAVYPYAAGNALAGSTLTAEVPAAQTLKAGSFQSGAAVAVAYTTGNSLTFHQATAILQVTLDTDMNNVESIEFSGNNNEYVAGAVDVAMNTSNGAITSVTPGTESKKVTLTGSFSAGETYYLSFIPQDFTNGVTVLVNFDGDKTGIVTSSKRLETIAGTNYRIANFTRISLPKISLLDKYSFNYDEGSVQNLVPESSANIASITVDSAPAGWEIAWNTNLFEVTPPTQAEIQATPQTVVPEGVFEVTLRSAAGHTRQVEIPVRLYGINSLDDLLAFRDKHGATGTLDASKIAALPTTCADYLVGGSLMLNADITLARSTMYSAIPAYFIHHLYVPLNGNNRTITADYKSNLAVCTLFQYLHGNVSNLNIAGTFESEYTSGVANLATLAHYAAKDGIVIDNVNSTATLKYNSGNGGNIGGIIVRVDNDCAATVSNCTFDGTINVYNGVDKLAGIICLGTLDTGAKRTDVDKCTFSGTINYSSTTHNNSRIGGIMGSNERNGQITNCTSSGDININLYGSTMVSTSGRGVGGILGRCNAPASGYTMETTVNNNVFSGTITVTNGPSENASFYNKIIGTDLRPATQSGNDGTLGTINLSGAVAGALSFDDASTVTFAYGETKEFDITASGLVAGVDALSLPAGWTVDCSAWSTGKVSVTAPERDAIIDNSAVGIGNVTLNATLTDASVVAADNAKSVRLYGINNNDEWTAFKTAYGSSNGSYAAGTSYAKRLTDCAEYIVNDEITLNSNISVSGTNFAIHHLEHGLNGNGKTITMTISGSAWPLGMCQYLYGTTTFSIHDVTLAGTLTWTWNVTAKGTGSTPMAGAGAIAAQNQASDVTLENVINKVNFIWTSPAENGTLQTLTNVGGYFGWSNGKTLRFKNCVYQGSITKNCRSFNVGGYLGWNAGTNKVYFDNCSFTGSISCTSTQDKTVMESLNYGFIGGFIGTSDSQAAALIEIKASHSSGTITLTDGARAVGGFVGKLSAPCSFVDDDESNHCTFTGKINFTETQAAHANRDIIGGFIGRHTAQALSMTNCVGTSASQINFTGPSYTAINGLIGQDAGGTKTLTDNTSETVINIVTE